MSIDNQCGPQVRRQGIKVWPRLIAAMLLMTCVQPASSRQFQTTESLKTELVADFRYGIGVRLAEREPAIANNTLFDESDYRFDKGDIVTNRLDVTPQLTLTYEPQDFGWLQSIGARTTAYVFKDFAYSADRVSCRPGTAPVINPGDFSQAPDSTPPGRLSYCDSRVVSYSGGKYNGAVAKQHFEGGESLEAFAFANFNVAESAVSVKAGKHALFWGEALLNAFLGVAYGMGPIDLNKAITVPGAGVQDIFLPLNQISAKATINEAWSFGLQYPLDWKGPRAPDGGTYFGLADPFLDSPDQFFLANVAGLGPLTLRHDPSVEGENKNKFGLQLIWSPEFMQGGTWGLYYREFDETVLWLHAMPANPDNQPGPFGNLPPGSPVLPGAYRYVYPRDTTVMGLTASQEFFGTSFAAEIVYSQDRALNSELLYIDDEGKRARGNTWSGVVNAIYLGPEASLFGFTLWDGSVMLAEANWSYLEKLTDRPERYKGVGTAACRADAAQLGVRDTPGETIDGCSSRYHVGAAVVFIPFWYQVLPGVDLSGTFVYMDTLKNNSPIQLGGNEGFMNGSVGITADFYKTISATLSYNFYDSQYRTGQNGDGETVVTTFNGLGTLADRDYVSWSLKYSF